MWRAQGALKVWGGGEGKIRTLVLPSSVSAAVLYPLRTSSRVLLCSGTSTVYSLYMPDRTSSFASIMDCVANAAGEGLRGAECSCAATDRPARTSMNAVMLRAPLLFTARVAATGKREEWIGGECENRDVGKNLHGAARTVFQATDTKLCTSDEDKNAQKTSGRKW